MINERLIETFGRDNLIKLLGDYPYISQALVNRLYRDTTTVRTDDLACIDALDNYLVELLQSNKLNNNSTLVNNYRELLFKLFLKNPQIAYDSVFFRRDIAMKFFNEDQIRQIGNYKKQAALSFREKTSILVKKQGMKVDDDLLRFAIYNIGYENEKSGNVLEFLYQYLITNRQVNTSYYAKEFLMKYTSYKAAKDLDVPPPNVYLSDYKMGGAKMVESNLGCNYGNTGIITINKSSLMKNIKLYNNIPALYNYMMVVSHETRHSKQAYDVSKDKISSAGFYMTGFELFYKYLSDKDFNEYHANYTHSEIEEDANRYGWYYTYKLASQYCPDDGVLLEKISSNRIRQAFQELTPTKINRSGMKHEEAWKYNVEKMDEIVKKHPEELKKYPNLKVVYKPDGTRRNFVELIHEESKFQGNDRNEVEKIFQDYYTYEIASGSYEKIDMNALDKETKFNVFIKMAQQLIKEYESVKNSIKVFDKHDRNIEFRQKEFLFVNKKRIARIKRITEYFNRNSSLINELTSIDVRENNHRFFGLTFDSIDSMRKSLYYYYNKLESYHVTDQEIIDELNSLKQSEYNRRH